MVHTGLKLVSASKHTRPRSSSQPQCQHHPAWCHLESWQWRPQWRLITCITKCLQKQKWGFLFAAFPTLPLETFLLVISSPGADPLSPGSNTRYLGIRYLTFHILSHLTHYFGSDLCLSFREKEGGNLPCFEGIKCDNTALTSQGAGENSNDGEFLHINTKANLSIWSHMVSMAHIGNSLISFCLLHAWQLSEGVCFIPNRVGNLCLIYYSLKIHTGFSILSSMSSDTIF